MKTITLTFAYLATSLTHAEPKTTRSEDSTLFDKVKISYDQPEGYTLKKLGNDGRQPPALFFTHQNGGSTINITSIDKQIPENLRGKESIKPILASFSEKYVKGSVEGKINAKEVKTDRLVGSYTTFTDSSMDKTKPVPKGKFSSVSIGVFHLENRILLVRIFHNTTESLTQALDIVKSMKVEQDK